LLVGGVVAPLVEEIFFRGFVFAALRERYRFRRAVVASASLAFLAAFLLQTMGGVP
jgi:membrane protease YdiL (CAAX protease family)